MLLPNAMFFNHCDDVVKIVDGKTLAGGGPLPIYYPEREYRKAHRTQKNSVLVTTFPDTIACVTYDSILNGT